VVKNHPTIILGAMIAWSEITKRLMRFSRRATIAIEAVQEAREYASAVLAVEVAMLATVYTYYKML